MSNKVMAKRGDPISYHPPGPAPVAAWTCPLGDCDPAELSEAEDGGAPASGVGAPEAALPHAPVAESFPRGAPAAAGTAEGCPGGRAARAGPAYYRIDAEDEDSDGVGGFSDAECAGDWAEPLGTDYSPAALAPFPSPRTPGSGRALIRQGGSEGALGVSRSFKIAGIVAAVLAGTALTSAATNAARGAQGHSGDGALEENGRLNMKAFAGRISTAALPSLRAMAGLPPSVPDDDIEKAEAAAFLRAAQTGAPQAAMHVSDATSAAIADAQKTLGIFTMKSSVEGSSGGSASCAPVAAACGGGGPECCSGSRCDEGQGGRCVLTLPAPVPQDLANTSSDSGSVKNENTTADVANAAFAEPAAEWPTSRCAKSGQSCLESRCCVHPGHTCFRQHDWWASCNATCSKSSSWDPGQKAWVPVEASGGPGGWSCEVLAAPSSSRIMHDPGPRNCTDSGEQCAGSRCCRHSGSKCYVKDKNWASCNATCSPHRRWDEAARAWVDSSKKEWECKELLPGGSAPPEEESGSSIADYWPAAEDDITNYKK